ncbi:MAG TPA: sulfurtransferase [Burkholderiales bacterium]|nr:sulfurtransferase [Burkholderiales bacterium]
MSHTTLVQAAELAAHLGDPNWIVFDCRHDLVDFEAGRLAYLDSHILGARFAHLEEDLSGPRTGKNGRHPLPNPEKFAGWLAKMGVDETKQVVAYDASGAAFASRLWWMLKWLGHGCVAVLDGGFRLWTSLGFPVTSELPKITPASFKRKIQENFVDSRYIEAQLHRPDCVIIDARSPERFRGQNETLDPVGGHIPGAHNRFFMNNLDSEGRFKPRETLRQDFIQLTADCAPEQVVHQCGSGVTACQNLLAMEIAGLHGSKLYPGSWSEWCADSSRPISRD